MTNQASNSEAASETPIAASEVFTIYCHIHVDSERRYIGLTKKTWKKRWNRHVYEAKHVKSGYGHFHNAIRKYGPDAFSHEVLEICQDLEFANEREKYWIAHFDTQNPEKGFNIVRGGSHTPHPVKNPWDRPGFRELVTTAIVNGLSDPVVAANRAAGAAKRRQTVSEPAFREAASARGREMAARPGFRENLREVQTVRAQDPEYLKQLSERWSDPEYREKCSTGLVRGTELLKSRTHCPQGHKYTPENTSVQMRGNWINRTCRACHNAKTRARTPKGPPPSICNRGHQLTPDLIFANAGTWRCKQCNRDRVAAYICKKKSSLMTA